MKATIIYTFLLSQQVCLYLYKCMQRKFTFLWILKYVHLIVMNMSHMSSFVLEKEVLLLRMNH